MERREYKVPNHLRPYISVIYFVGKMYDVGCAPFEEIDATYKLILKCAKGLKDFKVRSRRLEFDKYMFDYGICGTLYVYERMGSRRDAVYEDLIPVLEAIPCEIIIHTLYNYNHNRFSIRSIKRENPKTIKIIFPDGVNINVNKNYMILYSQLYIDMIDSGYQKIKELQVDIPCSQKVADEIEEIINTRRDDYKFKTVQEIATFVNVCDYLGLTFYTLKGIGTAGTIGLKMPIIAL